MSSLLYGRSTFRNDAVCQLFARVIGPAQSHEVDELWDIFIMITPTLTGFLSLMASTCEVKVGMKADARCGSQSSSVNIVKVLPSPLFNGNLSEWTLTTRAPRSLQQELSMVSFLVQIVTMVPHSCRTLWRWKKINVESKALVQSFNPIFDFSLELPTKAS